MRSVVSPSALFAIAWIGWIVIWLAASERFLATELGPEAYQAYQRRAPMLVPFT
jgi:protein-S-isoprenylcysteine O-methyltransferase Ste14